MSNELGSNVVGRQLETQRLIAVITALAVAGLAAHYLLGAVYPTGPLVIFVAVGGIFALGVTGRASYPATIGAICLVSAAYRVVILGVPSGVLAPDPAWYLEQTALVSEAGDPSVIESGFYREIPGYILLLTTIGEITGVSAETVFIAFSGGVCGVFPLLAGSVARRLSADNAEFAGLATAAIVAVGWHSVYFSYYTIPQTLAIGLLLATALVLSIGDRLTTKVQYAIPLLVLIGGLLYSHKLSLVYGAVLLVAFAAVDAYNRDSKRRSLIVLALVVILFAVQYVFLTDDVARIAARIGPGLMSLLGNAETAAPSGPTHAVNPGQGSTAIRAWSNLHLLGIALVSGLSWAGLAYWKRGVRKHQYALVLSAFLVFLGGIALALGSSLTPIRFLGLAEIGMAVVIGVAVSQLAQTVSPSRRYAAIGIVVLVAGTQLAVIGAVPDDPRTANRFLTGPEADSIDYGESYADTVHSDYIYSRYSDEFASADVALFNATLPNNETDTIAYRTDRELFRSTPYSGDWRLLWDPQERLNSDCSQIFINDGTAYYRCG